MTTGFLNAIHYRTMTCQFPNHKGCRTFTGTQAYGQTSDHYKRAKIIAKTKWKDMLRQRLFILQGCQGVFSVVLWLFSVLHAWQNTFLCTMIAGIPPCQPLSWRLSFQAEHCGAIPNITFLKMQVIPFYLLNIVWFSHRITVLCYIKYQLFRDESHSLLLII